jgi:hypothetical protein
MSICEGIYNIITDPKRDIRTHFHISNRQWNKWTESIRHKKDDLLGDEKEGLREDHWTFIVASAYAIDGDDGCKSLLKTVSDQQLPDNSENEPFPIWSKYSPYTCKDPRSGRGSKAKIIPDLAFGNFVERENTEAEIVYVPPPKGNGWICFVEIKLLEDISGDSTDNPTYNQLAKYIKGALNFHEYCDGNEKKYPENIHITLITPKKFMINPHSRLYGYKFEDYRNKDTKTINVNNIKDDIPDIAENEYFDDIFCLNLLTESGIDDRLKKLKLHWIPYENLLDNIPDTNPLKKYIDKIRAANPIFDKPSESK